MTIEIERIRRTILPPFLALSAIMCIYFSILTTRVELPRVVNVTVEGAEHKQNLPNVQFISLSPPLSATGAIEEIKNASLFAQTRAPWVAKSLVIDIAEEPEMLMEMPQEQPPVERQPPNIRLVGIIMQGDNNARALVSNPDTEFEQWVVVDDTIGEWIVVEIQADNLLLRSGNDEFVVSYNR